MSHSQPKHAAFNARKRAILSVLERAYPGGLTAGELAWKVGISPTRAVYWTLNRLWRFGLIQRRHDSQGLLIYRITARGKARLAWLQRSVLGREGRILSGRALDIRPETGANR